MQIVRVRIGAQKKLQDIEQFFGEELEPAPDQVLVGHLVQELGDDLGGWSGHLDTIELHAHTCRKTLLPQGAHRPVRSRSELNRKGDNSLN